MAKASANVSSTLMLVASGRIPRTDLSNVARKLDELKHNTGSRTIPAHNRNHNPDTHNPNPDSINPAQPSVNKTQNFCL